MATPVITSIRYILNGEAVEASIANRPLQDIASLIGALQSQVGLLGTGHRLVDDAAVFDPAVVIGQPVYQDPSTKIYYPARADAGSTEVGGQAGPAAYVTGVVSQKTTSTTGVVTLYGQVTELTTAGWAAVMGGSFAAGNYFLSSITAGRLTTTPGALAVYVGTVSSDGVFFVRPQPPQYGHHTHLRVSLLGSPAGTLTDPAFGGTHVITTPNVGNRGWLPATPTYFPGYTAGAEIPAGAVFGYNWQHSAETTLQSIFPPIPVSGATLVQGGVLLDSTTVQVNQFGIWWMRNAYGQAPWPVDYGSSTTAPPIDFFESRRFGAALDASVTSLVSDPTSIVPFTITDAGGVPAAVGGLKIKLASLLTSSASNDEADTGVKSIAGAGFTTGPLARRIKAGAGVTVTGSAGDGTNGYYGLVTVAAAASALAGAAVLTSQLSLVTTTAQDFLLYNLPQGLTSYGVWTVAVPMSASATSTCTCSLYLYSPLSLVTPGSLSWTYKFVQPTTLGASLGAPTWAASTVLNGVTIDAGKVVRIDFSVPNVPVGARLLIRIDRVGSSDGLGVDLGMLGLNYVLT